MQLTTIGTVPVGAVCLIFEGTGAMFVRVTENAMDGTIVKVRGVAGGEAPGGVRRFKAATQAVV